MRFAWLFGSLAVMALSGCNKKGSEKEMAANENSASKTNEATMRRRTMAMVPIAGDTYKPSPEKTSLISLHQTIPPEFTTLFELPPEAKDNPNFYKSQEFRKSQFDKFKTFLNDLFTRDIQDIKTSEKLAEDLKNAGMPPMDPQEPLEMIPYGSIEFEASPIDLAEEGHKFLPDAASVYLTLTTPHGQSYDVLRIAIPVVLQPNAATMWYLVWVAYASEPSKIEDGVSRFLSDGDQGEAWKTDEVPHRKLIGESVQKENGSDPKSIPFTFEERVPPIILYELKRRMSVEHRRIIAAAGSAYYYDQESPEESNVVEKSEVFAYKDNRITSNFAPN